MWIRLCLVIVLLWLPAAADELATVQTFYGEYVKALQASKASVAGQIDFLQAHRQQLEPSLYQGLLQHQQDWLRFQQHKAKAPFVTGCDLLTGSPNPMVRKLVFKRTQPGRVAVTYEADSARGRPRQETFTVVVSDDKITDIEYSFNTARKLLKQIAEAR